MKTILILAANPRGDLRVDQEIRDLKKVIKRSQNSDNFNVETELAVLPEDLQELLYDNQPYIVHFCGHGTRENDLVFESEDRGEQRVSYQAFSNLLKNSNSRKNIQCVLLNACHTKPLVDLIVEHIPYAIGTSKEILDKAAYWFAVGFYKALVREQSIETCCQWGCSAVESMMPNMNLVTESTGQFRKAIAIEEDGSEISNKPLKIILKCNNSLENLSKESSFSSNIPPELEQELLQEGRRKKYRDNLRNVLDNFGTTILKRDEQISDFELKQRKTLINKVKDFWIEGFLTPSLYFNTAIDTNIDRPSGQVLRPLDNLEVIPFDIDESYEVVEKTDITGQINDGNTLLILGEPGSGKTIALLQLAEKLIARTEQNTERPIPVVFNLSSWNKKQSFEEWLIEELKDKYQVPKVWSEPWIKEQQLTLLLDGLDEVKAEHRNACVRAINKFIASNHLETEIIICSRVNDYEALSERLLLSSVICIQPLSRQQLLDFLENADDSLLGLKTVIEQDEAIAQFARTPLILNMMTWTYQGWSTEQCYYQFRIREDYELNLFESYIEKNLNREEIKQKYPKEKVLYWLGWLAEIMVNESKIIFLIEKMQPTLLQSQGERISYRISNFLLAMITVWLIVSIICSQINGWMFWVDKGREFGLLLSLNSFWDFGMNVGTIEGLIAGVIAAFSKKIILFEQISLSWSWQRTKSKIIYV